MAPLFSRTRSKNHRLESGLIGAYSYGVNGFDGWGMQVASLLKSLSLLKKLEDREENKDC